MFDIRFSQIMLESYLNFKKEHPDFLQWPVHMKNFSLIIESIQNDTKTDEQKSNEYLSALFTYLLAGGGLVYDQFKEKINDSANKDIIYDAETGNRGDEGTFIENIKAAFRHAPVYNKEVDELLDRIKQFQGLSAKRTLYDGVKNVDPFVNALVSPYEQLGDKVLSYGISEALLMQASGLFIDALIKRAPVTDRSDLWIKLIKMKTIAPDAKVNGKTLTGYWHTKQPRGYYIFPNKPGSEEALNHAESLLLKWVAHVDKNFTEKDTWKDAAAEKIALLGQPFDPLTLKTPLQQAAMLYVKFSGDIYLLNRLENQIIGLLKLESNANNNNISKTTPSHISIAQERGELWIESLLAIDEEKFGTIYKNIPPEMFVEFKEKKLDVKLIKQIRNPFALTTEERKLENNRRKLIKGILNGELNNAVTQADDVEVLLKANSTNNWSAIFVTSTVLRLVQMTTSDQFDSYFKNNLSLQLEQMSKFKFDTKKNALVFGSVGQSLALLTEKNSFYHTNPYAMVDRFIDLLKNLELLFNHVEEEHSSQVGNTSNVNPDMSVVFMRMLLCATPGQTGAIKSSNLYKALLEINKNIESFIPSDEVRDQSIFYLINELKTSANNCLSSSLESKIYDKADHSCAQFIKTALEEKSYPSFYEKDKNVPITSGPILALIKILLRIIDYRISSYLQEEKKYDKAFYKDLIKEELISQPAPLTLLSLSLVNQFIAPHKSLFIAHIDMSLAKIVPINYADSHRVRSLKDSLDFLSEKLGFKMQDIDLPLTKAIYQRLSVFYTQAEHDQKQSASSSSQTVLVNYNPNVSLHYVEKNNFMLNVIQKAKKYYERSWNSIKPGNPEKSLRYAQIISQLTYDPNKQTENLRQILFVDAIINIVSFRICSFDDDKYEKSLYSDTDGFRFELQKLPDHLLLSEAHKEALLEKIYEALKTPGLSARQDEVRVQSLLADLNLFIKKFDLPIEKIEKDLADTGFVAVYKNEKGLGF